MFPATVSCGQPWSCCQTAYGSVSATAAATPTGPHHDTSGRRGPTTSSDHREDGRDEQDLRLGLAADPGDDAGGQYRRPAPADDRPDERASRGRWW